MPKKQPSLTSETLLVRVRDIDDRQAWDEFVEQYAPKIFSWCKHYRLQESDAADVTQEVLCKLIKAMRSFQYDKSRGRFRSWLKTVTANAMRDMAKARARAGYAAGGTSSDNDAEGSGRARIMELLEDEKATNALNDAIEAAYEQELLRTAELAVQMRVKPHTWEAYQLTAVQQLSATDAAKQLNLRVGDVYVAKSRVIKMLRIEVSAMEESME